MSYPHWLTLDSAERQRRLEMAFCEAGIASSHMLHAVLATVYRLSPDELAHAHRVSQVSIFLGKVMGLPDVDIAYLGRAALIHDLGKLVVSDATHPAPSEWKAADVPRAWHDQLDVACGIAGAVPFLRPARPLVRASREAFDGSGFPNGLAGDRIPMGARILHFADMRDALQMFCQAATIPADAIEAGLLEHAGSRFDPEVVSAWMESTNASDQDAEAGAQ